ncbi:SSS family solute:Na+ symporter [Caldalkalibacillus uzonensis]|uniref:SSS family solute:Na+ symporter n=1 Tax=Caldalkalibacillus uzonensis TaxID=353224 RepID=A0ABU0CYF0_9BACI|nr:sodium:solute symporter family protein [Caldalkalibacillus uzonensis]MDQ0341173.1 SSS family solute:Na+ symporter [Caldalkalibacillus uzonensis]
MLIALLFFIIYCAFILYFGKYGLSQSSRLRMFFVAQHRLGLWPSVFTFCATWMSATSFLALTGSFYLEGLSPLYTVIAGWITGALLLFTIVIPLRKIDLLTIPSYFCKRFQSPFLQVWSGVVIVVTHIFYMVFQIYGFGIVLSYLLEIPYVLAVFLVYMFLIYTTFGGLYSIARTDTINFMWMLLSIGILAVLIGIRLGRDDKWGDYGVLASDPNFHFQELASLGENCLSIALSFLMIFLIWALGKASHTQYLIRILSAKDHRTAFNMLKISLPLLLICYLAIAFIGTGSVLVVSDYALVNPNEIILLIIAEVTNSIWGSFLLIGILASAVSTANSQLHLFCISMSYDIVLPIMKYRWRRSYMITFNRFMIFFGATLALLLSINPPLSILGLGSYLWGILAFCFFFPLYGGLLWRRATSQGAITSIVSSSVIGGVLIGYDFYVQSLSFHPAAITILIACVSFVLISYITSRREVNNDDKQN